jgi:hypothetical protein
MVKTLTEAAQLLQRISKAAAMRRDWETRLAGEPEHNSRMKMCTEISKEATPEVTKEDTIPEKLEEEHIESRTTPSVDFAEPNGSSNIWIGFQSITEKYSTREDRSLTKRGWHEHWKEIFHRKRKRKIHTTLKPLVRSF